MFPFSKGKLREFLFGTPEDAKYKNYRFRSDTLLELTLAVVSNLRHLPEAKLVILYPIKFY